MALVAVGIVVAIPLCNRSGTNFGIQPGLLLACGIFFATRYLGVPGGRKNERRHFAALTSVVFVLFPFFGVRSKLQTSPSSGRHSISTGGRPHHSPSGMMKIEIMEVR